jgi:uncharacterized membrane-anchored protein YhcB (DUF1043 family)
MWWGCVVFLVLGVVIGFFLAAILTVGKFEDLSQRLVEWRRLSILGYKITKLAKKSWKSPKLRKHVKDYQKRYKEMKNNA